MILYDVLKMTEVPSAWKSQSWIQICDKGAAINSSSLSLVLHSGTVSTSRDKAKLFLVVRF